MTDVYVVGTLSKFDEIQKAALFYLNCGYSVSMVRPQPDKTKEECILECFKNIDNCDMLIVAVPHEDGILGDGTLYEIAYAKKMGIPYSIWKGEENE